MSDQLWIAPAAALVIGYSLGSIPFGLVLTRLTGAGDLRAIGSGSIGATNVLRTGRKGLAALTVLLDLGKGVAAIFIAEALREGLGPLGAVGAFLGHLYPLWLGFNGGKGVATLVGIALGFSLLTGDGSYLLGFAVVWLGVVALTRYSSVGGMSAAVALPVIAAARGRFELVALFLAFALMVLWKHRGNVSRLLNGSEPKLGAKHAHG